MSFALLCFPYRSREALDEIAREAHKRRARPRLGHHHRHCCRMESGSWAIDPRSGLQSTRAIKFGPTRYGSCRSVSVASLRKTKIAALGPALTGGAFFLARFRSPPRTPEATERA